MTPNTGHSYFSDPEHAEEMVRLNRQSEFLTKGLGGLMAEIPHPESLHNILDLACGPGHWALTVALEYPDTQVSGVDISERMIEYAQVQAEEHHIENASFQVMDITKPLNFKDDTFDLVNARLITSFMPASAWPALLAECRRVLRPGGLVRLTEFELPISNHPTHDQVLTMLHEAMRRAGHGFSKDQRSLGVLTMLPTLLATAGFQATQTAPRFLEYRPGTDAYRGYEEDTQSMHLAFPFVKTWGTAISEEAFVDLCHQAHREIESPSFYALQPFLTVTARKP